MTLTIVPWASRGPLRPLQIDLKPVIVTGAVIDPDFGGLAQGSDDDVDLPVSVEIPPRRPPMPPARRLTESGFLRQGFELAVSQIPKNSVVLLDPCDPFHVHGLNVAAGHKQILPSIIIKVEEPGAIPRHVLRQDGETSLYGQLLKGPVSQVVEYRECFVVQSYEGDVRTPVVVVIGG